MAKKEQTSLNVVKLVLVVSALVCVAGLFAAVGYLLAVAK